MADRAALLKRKALLERKVALEQQISTQSEVTPTTPQSNQVDTSGSDRLLAGAGLAVAGAGALGARKIAQPFLKRGVDTRAIQQIGKPFGIPTDVPPSFVPERLGELQTQAKQAIKPAIADFDETVLKTSVKDLTQTIETGQGEWLKKPTIKYGKTLDALSSEMANRGIQLNGDELDIDVVSKTIDDARARGIPEEKLKSLVKLRKDIKKDISPIRDAKGKVIRRNINLTKAKGRVSGYINSNQGNPTANMMRDRWGLFLEKSAPEDIQIKLAELNKSYEPFAQARRTLTKIKDPRTGKYDTVKLNRYLSNYVKQAEDTGTKDILRMLSEGEGIAEPVPGAKSGVAKLESTKSNRDALKIKMNKQVDRISTARSKAKLLSAKIARSNQRIKVRGNVTKGVVKAGLLFGGAKFLSGLAVAPQILQAANFAKDPQKWLAEQQMPDKDIKTFKSRDKFEKWRKDNPGADSFLMDKSGQMVPFNPA